jgi:hypothetical protein
MFSRLIKLIESLLYAGLKPDGGRARADAPEPASGDDPVPERSRLRTLLDRFIAAGPAPSDPLYLSNRTLAQRLRTPLVLGVALAVVVLVVVLAMGSRLYQPAGTLPAALTPAEMAARMLPNLDKLNLESNRDIEILNTHVEPGRLTGTARNNTGRTIRSVDVVFSLADTDGSQLGAVNGELKNLAPNSSSSFAFAIPQRNAYYVLVREVRER